MLLRGLYGFGLAAVLAAGGFFISRKLARIGLVIDDAFAWGDVPALPAEAKRAGENGSGGGRNEALQLVAHDNGLNRTDRRGSF